MFYVLCCSAATFAAAGRPTTPGKCSQPCPFRVQGKHGPGITTTLEMSMFVVQISTGYYIFPPSTLPLTTALARRLNLHAINTDTRKSPLQKEEPITTGTKDDKETTELE
jgi:hypothetical protein